MRSAIKNNAILGRWVETLKRRGSAPAILGPDGAVARTFAEIESEAAQWAARLANFAHFDPGAVVAIQAGNSPAWPALILAAMRAGAIPLPLGAHMAREEREAALTACHAGALLLEGQGTLEIEPRDHPTLPLPACDFLKLTSGTTSLPRAICFTAAQLVADCDNICDTMGLAASDLNFGVIPFSHSYGFSNLITPLLCRGIPLVAADDRMPRAILNHLTESGATIFPGMPIFFEKLAELPGVSLPALRLCISAGAPLPARVGQAFTARYGLKIHTFYGSSECGGIAYDTSDDPIYEEGFVGPPMHNVQVAPAGDDSGQIAVHSLAVGQGYYPDPDPEVLSPGQFIPADLVRITSRGLYLTGRVTDVINIAGRKLNPAEIEQRLTQCPGVRQVVVFGIASNLRNEEVIACVTGTASAAEILRFARTLLSGWQVPRDIWLVNELPVNPHGKISRRDLARAYREMGGSRPTFGED
jgi:long-chain acyl-CoA synthetase